MITAIPAQAGMAARVRQTVEVTGRIVGKELVLSLPRPESVPVQVQGNQIFVGDQRIVVRLEPDLQTTRRVGDRKR